ncbi:MAG: hopanoid biosynthesis-associated protein HpnK [Acidobacteriota bacterium]
MQRNTAPTLANSPRATSLQPLIINGDDFGYSPAVNQAILQAHRRGILTSASLMVNEAAATEAVEIARAHSSLAVGLHLSLVLGKSTLAQAQIPHLVDRAGNFSRSPFLAGLKYFFHPAARRELRSEMRAQFERFATTGLRLSHVDGHNHLHMHPVVFRELLNLCEEFDVRRVRIVTGQRWPHFRITRRNLAANTILSLVFGRLGAHCRRQVAGRDFLVPRVVHGLLQSGRLTESYLIELVSLLEGGGGEIYLHPRTAEASEAERLDNPGGELELAALLSPRLRGAIEAHGFRLASYETYLSDTY